MFFPLEWSAPSAIGIAGLGGGFEVGIEVSGRYYTHDLFSKHNRDRVSDSDSFPPVLLPPVEMVPLSLSTVHLKLSSVTIFLPFLSFRVECFSFIGFPSLAHL